MDHRIFLSGPILQQYRGLQSLLLGASRKYVKGTPSERPKRKLLSANYTGRTIGFSYLEVTIELSIYRTLNTQNTQKFKNTEQANPSDL